MRIPIRSILVRGFAAFVCVGVVVAMSGGCDTTNVNGTAQADPPAAATMRIRIADTRQRPGYRMMQDGSGRSLYVSLRDELTERDVHLARAYHAHNGSMVELILKPAAAARFGVLTRENLGAWIAFLVDEQLVSAAMIQSEIQSGVAYISGLPPEQAERLAASLCSRQPSSDDPMRE